MEGNHFFKTNLEGLLDETKFMVLKNTRQLRLHSDLKHQRSLVLGREVQTGAKVRSCIQCTHVHLLISKVMALG